ncbi:MAG: PHP domain-containing protein [Planctomycetota bacterium]
MSSLKFDDPVVPTNEFGGADLHLHTVHSDGSATPAEAVQRAKDIGLSAIAITDHDTTAGLAYALRQGEKLGVEVIPGVELSASDHAGEIHIVGLFIDPREKALGAKLKEIRRRRRERIAEMSERLAGMDIDVAPETVLEIASRANPGRPHMAAALINAGYAANYNEAFRRYLGDNAPAYVPKMSLPPEEAIDLIANAGGVSVLAHPLLTGRDELIPSLAEAGLGAIEVYWAQQNEADFHYYLRLAHEYDLALSGGADWHGAWKDDSYLGRVRVPAECVDRLRGMAQTVRL